MPAPQRIRPVPQPVQGRVTRLPPEDPLAGFVPVSEAVTQWEHMLLYGRNRIGKSTFACQFPKPMWVCSIEPAKTGGARSLAKLEGVQYKRFDNTDALMALGLKLRSMDPDDIPFQSIALDGLGSLDDIALKEICHWSETSVMLKFGKVTTDQYVQRSERVRNVLRPFVDLERHVVFIANEKDHNAGESRKVLTRGIHAESHLAAGMSEGTTKWLQDACDHICQMYMDKEAKLVEKVVGKGTRRERTISKWVETGRFIRRLRLMYHPNFAAGIRAADPQIVPEYVEGETPEDLYNNFMSVVNGTYQPINVDVSGDQDDEPAETEAKTEGEGE